MHLFYFIFMYMSVLQACRCTTFLPHIHGGQKRAPDSLELESQVVVSRSPGCLKEQPVLLTPKLFQDNLLKFLLSPQSSSNLLKSLLAFLPSPPHAWEGTWTLLMLIKYSTSSLLLPFPDSSMASLQETEPFIPSDTETN